MSQRNRIALATAALLAALFLAVPSPSHAAVQPWKLPSWERAWSWLAQLLPGGAPQKPGGRQEKEGIGINPIGGTTSGATVGTQPDGGVGPNPDGTK